MIRELSVRQSGLARRLIRFFQKSWPEKRASFGFRYFRWFPGAVLPLRLPYGVWWLARADFCGLALLSGSFEPREVSFTDRFLRPGMVVLDIGAHHGFYAVLASKRVQPGGIVFAFEPSPRERKKLVAHLHFNRCQNVHLESVALGSNEGEETLFVVDGSETGCNSLRPPRVGQAVSQLRVRQSRLDTFLEMRQIERVDFIKMDVEGGERRVLEGAVRLLDRRPRPVVLCEVQDLRTQAWGYPAREIIRFLSVRGYEWFSPDGEGRLSPIDADSDSYDGNFVAVPDERFQELRAYFG